MVIMKWLLETEVLRVTCMMAMNGFVSSITGASQVNRSTSIWEVKHFEYI
jgi:hypothetical protein